MINHLYYLTNRKDYYQRLIFPQNLQVFYSLEKDKNQLFTSQQVLDIQGVHLGCDMSYLIKMLGNPRYELPGNDFSDRILFYKDKISGNKIITQFHFFDNKLLFAVKSVHSVERSFRKLIKTAILNKYNNDINNLDEYFNQMNDFCFTDKNKNEVFVREGVLLEIIYVNDYSLLKQIVENKRKRVYDMEKERTDTIIKSIAANF